MIDTRKQDIIIGAARIVAACGPNQTGMRVWGWALPGGKFTPDRDEATRAARIINRMMTQ